MKKILIVITLLALTIGGVAIASEFTRIGYDLPTTYTDGSAIPSGTSVTIKIFCASSPTGTALKTSLITGATSTVLSGVACVTNGVNYFSASAVVGGTESAKTTMPCSVIASNGRFYDQLPTPSAPGGCSFF